MWPFKNKYDKLTRESVVDAICQLEKQADDIEKSFDTTKEEIAALKEKGKKETDRGLKLYYAKKINALKAERDQNVQRVMYIMYNVTLLNKLKQAIDDKTFYANTSKASLGNLLGDQKGLAKFLNDVLGTRVAAEDVLTSADETFKNIESAYDTNKTIYGKNESDDELLAMFETEESVENEMALFDKQEKQKAQGEEDN